MEQLNPKMIQSIIRFGPPVRWTFHHSVTSEEDANEVQDNDGDTDVYIHTINNFHQY
jgi:hypothetical protein